MSRRDHEVGLIVVLLSAVPSWQYFPIVVVVIAHKLISRGAYVPKGAVNTLMPILIMAACGLVFAGANPTFDALKDVWYALKMLFFAFLGLHIGYRDRPSPKWLRTTAIYSMVAFIVEAVIFSVTNASWRVVGFIPPFAPVFLAMFYIYSPSSGSTKYRVLKWICAILVVAVGVAAESRTTLLLMGVTWLGVAGIFRNRAKIALSVVAVLAVAMMTTPLLPEFDPHNISFLGKVQNSINEMIFVTDNDMTSITTNWRGFEASQAFEAWWTGGLGRQIFGHGLGAATDIGFYYDLFEDYAVRYLPILHNGYFMVLVKYGVLGLVFFVLFMTAPFFLFARKDGVHSKLEENMGLTASVILLLTSLSITGPLNLSKLDGITLLMGWAIGRYFQVRNAYRSRGREQMDKIAPARVGAAPPQLKRYE